MAPTSFCDARDLLAVGLECTGTPGTALRGSMTTYMPNGGMYAPPAVAARRGEGKREKKNRSKFKAQKAKGKIQWFHLCHLPFVPHKRPLTRPAPAGESAGRGPPSPLGRGLAPMHLCHFPFAI